MLGCKFIIAYDSNSKHVSAHKKPLHDPARYKQFVRMLNYLTMTQADIALLMSVVSQIMPDSRSKH